MSRYRIQRNGEWEWCDGSIVGVTEQAVTVADPLGATTEIPMNQVQGWMVTEGAAQPTVAEAPAPEEP